MEFEHFYSIRIRILLLAKKVRRLIFNLDFVVIFFCTIFSIDSP